MKSARPSAGERVAVPSRGASALRRPGARSATRHRAFRPRRARFRCGNEANVVDRPADLDPRVQLGKRLLRAPVPAAGGSRRNKVGCLRVHPALDGGGVDRPQPATTHAYVLACRIGRLRREETLTADAVQPPAQRIGVQRAGHTGHGPARSAGGNERCAHVVPSLRLTTPARLASELRTAPAWSRPRLVICRPMWSGASSGASRSS